MNLIKLTSTHYFGFLYLAFAHLTDGKYVREEQLTIWKLITKWTGSQITKGEFACVMDDVMDWYKRTMNQEEFEEEVFDIARRINEYVWFDKEKKIESLKDLKEIALADNKYIKNEKLWIKKIAQIWEIDLRTLKNILTE
ncbi:MAG: TerB family tellurite resistance protein [Bacteroidota bacterium]